MMKIRTLILILALAVGLCCCKKDKDSDLVLPAELATVKANLAASFDTLNSSMAATVSALAVSGIDTADVRNKLQQLYAASSFVKEFSFLTPQGIMQLIEPAIYYPYQGSDISGQSHVIAAFQTKQPVLSNVFPAIEGFNAASIIHPIVANNQLLGGIDALFVPEEILGRIILPVVKNQSFEIWVMENNGLVIYDQDTAEIGLNILTDPLYAAFPELIAACQKIAAEDSGETTYSFFQTGTSSVVTKKTYWDTYTLYGKEWKIVWVKPE